jgi:pantetheine-phosphate adenylyltransferase
MSDFEYEFQLQLMNRRLAPGITGVYMMPSESNMYLSSTLVKEIARHGGDISSLVLPCVRGALEERGDNG